MSILKVASKKAKNGYTFKVDFRYKTNGITTRYVKSGFLTKKEAKEHEEDIKAQIRLYGRVKKIYNGTLNMCFDEWLKVDSNQLAPNTINLYKQTYNKYVKNTIGKEKLVLLKYKEIQAFINKSDISYDNCIAIKKVLNMVFNFAVKNEYVENNPIQFIKNTKVKDKKDKNNYITFEEYQTLTNKINQGSFNDRAISIAISIGYYTGLRVSDDDDKIRLNQRKPSKYKGLSRFGPEKNLQRINKFMKERPTFYKKLIQMKENFRFYLRCFYCITKVVILQFNSEKQDRISS